MNSTVTSGTPRHNSMNAIDAERMTGSSDLRPSASRMPSGSENTMPVTATTSVTVSPPQLVVSTAGSPNSPPASNSKAMTG